MFGFIPQNGSRCGCFFHAPGGRKYIPLIKVQAHSLILSTASRTTLTQTFVNPLQNSPLHELQYEFPLYDGVSVVSFTCDVAGRLIRGVVKERQEARQTYDQAVAQGQTAGLLDQSQSAADVFSIRIGNIPPNTEVRVEIVLLGELRHDAEVDGLRFTLPTYIADRYGNSDLTGSNVGVDGGLSVTVDTQLPPGSSIKSIQSPTHAISVQIGSCSTDSPGEEASLQKASASLCLNKTEMNRDFVLLISGTNINNPTAVLETHPTIPNQCAIMTTLVPQFRLPAERPEIVFMCDRSGSMGTGQQIPNLIRALHIFLTSLPIGVKFNICSFGSSHHFLWPKSQSYSQTTLNQARQYIQGFGANFGGTEMYHPIEQVFERRYKDMNLELFVLTDGEIWNQATVFEMIQNHLASSKGAIRVFTLGIGRAVSHSLVEGIARAGNGFSQTVGDDEKMEKKVIRMLRSALSPHILDYSLEIKYTQSADLNRAEKVEDDGFELVESLNSITLTAAADAPQANSVETKPTISLFDTSYQDDDVIQQEYAQKDKYDHLPALSQPKYIQAPFQIPPLFPSIRTSVYVLLPEPLPNQIPKSVVFRATSAHGPLELDIPIISLSQKSEIIHQLAARKAVQELEEGRGWIFHARDSASGDLLRDRYDGQFSDMVECEAVRLGVNCQVAGKWCSFVAVDDQDKILTATEAPTFSKHQNMAMYVPAVELFKQTANANCTSLFGGAAPPMPPTGFQQGFRQSAQAAFGQNTTQTFAANTNNAFGRTSATTGYHKANATSTPQNVTGGGLFGASTQNMGSGGDWSAQQQQQQQSTGSSLFGAKSSSGLFGANSSSSAFGASTQNVGSGGLFGSNHTSLFGGINPQPVAQPLAPLGTSGDALQDITALQNFSGMWEWTVNLERVIRVRRQDAEQTVRSAGLEGGDRGAVLATLCTLLFLRHQLSGDKGAWSMMAGKARSLLNLELGSAGVVEEWEQALEGLFRA